MHKDMVAKAVDKAMIRAVLASGILEVGDTEEDKNY